MTPLQAGESRKATIKSQPFAAKLNRQRGVERVWHKITARVSSTAEIGEDSPVSGSGPQKMHFLARTKIIDEFKRLSQWSRLLKDFWMRDDPQATAQGQF